MAISLVAMGLFAIGLVVTGGGPAIANPRPAVCDNLAARLQNMTIEQVSLLTTVPLTGRVASQCAHLLKDDVAAGQHCITERCAAIDSEGLVIQAAGSPLDQRMSECAKSTSVLIKLNNAFDLLSLSFAKICARSSKP